MIRRWFFAGLLIWIPLGGTLLAVRFLFNLLDVGILLLPTSLRPTFPGVGVVLSLLLVFGTGALAANYLGNQLLTWVEAAVGRIPLVRSLYGGMKKLAENVLSENSSAFKKVVMVEWPRAGMWTIGFQAGERIAEIERRVGRPMVTVFVPTTPNPTSGFIMTVPRDEVTVLDMSIEDGMRYVISLGVVAPGHPAPQSLLETASSVPPSV